MVSGIVLLAILGPGRAGMAPPIDIKRYHFSRAASPRMYPTKRLELFWYSHSLGDVTYW